jgi:hypothetical protein
LWAACLYAAAVSTYRWNFLVIYVDDAIMHLMLFWLLLLPVGRTLVLGEWLSDGTKAWERWKTATVPGAAVRCFVANIALIYVVAGLWKWTSPMWRDGTAVYAILKTPLSYAPDWWGVRHLGFLAVMNHLALLLEPLFPLICLLRPGSRLRYLLIAALVGFHGFILATMRVPFANAVCIAAAAVLVRDDLMAAVVGRTPPAVAPAGPRPQWSGLIAAAMVAMLALAMLTSITLPDWRKPGDVHLARLSALDIAMDAGERDVDGLGRYQKVFFSALWAVGLAQQYQLLNWIDQRNFKFMYSIHEIGADGKAHPIDAHDMFPDNLRSVLLQSNLHGAVWLKIAPKHLGRLRESLKTRFAARYCRLFEPAGKLVVEASVRRTGVKVDGAEASPTFKTAFFCRAGAPVFIH